MFRLNYLNLTTSISPSLHIYHHPDQVQSLAKLKANENFIFENHLRESNADELDKAVFHLQTIASNSIDCTKCGNCCKSFMIIVEEHEADKASSALNISRSTFDEKYIEKGMNGMMLMNTIPCAFLNENQCSIYENRFSGCREFPALHLPHVQKRLFTIFQNYERCPIIFTVIEELKNKFEFKR